MSKPVLLVIIDGFGASDASEHDAIFHAKTPFIDGLFEKCPNSLIETSGLAVGLPEGQMGNSEVGHMSIGSGRVVLQDLPRIDAAIKSGEINENAEILAHVEALKKSGGASHILGMASDGGVHSSIEHLLFMARKIASFGIKTKIHAFLDGRDAPQFDSLRHLERLKNLTNENPLIEIATISGRFFAMDRDSRWERVQEAFEVMKQGAKKAATADLLEYVRKEHEKMVSDEFIRPMAAENFEGMQNGDGIMMTNFRADRVREILQSFLQENFDKFPRSGKVKFATALAMKEYSAELKNLMPAIFGPMIVKNPLGEILSDAGFSQLRIAETEKYAHVTFFFNGGRETQFPGETRIMIPSPEVKTYDLKPEMSAPELTERLISELPNFDFIVVNYANADMVGHTGKFEETKKAIEALDLCLEKLIKAVEAHSGIALITADHGNAEQMRDFETNEPHTSHTNGPVPLILVGRSDIKQLKNGSLQDITPTLLDLVGLAKPKEMTGNSLLVRSC